MDNLLDDGKIAIGFSTGEPSDGKNTFHTDDMSQDKKILIRHTAWRWVMLTFGCFFLMGSYFCFDNPAPLKTFLQEDPYNLTDTQWSYLYSIYSLPNMVLPLCGGILIDRVGIR